MRVPADPFILAVDTSTEVMTLALSGPQGLSALQADAGSEASAHVLDRLSAMLAEQGLVWGDLHAIAFGRGPGAFTGLRTACAVAQGLAFGAGLPVLAIDSLLAVAETYRGHRVAEGAVWVDAQEVGVVADARMGQVYASRYRFTGEHWVNTHEVQVCAPLLQDLNWQGWPAVVVGSGASLLPPVPTLRRLSMGMDPAGLMGAAQQAWRMNQACAPEQALPVYVRDKVAQTSAERAARVSLAG
jgi:tRNA threonylcarbamoyladenosine biosynthesis protein TsaB